MQNQLNVRQPMDKPDAMDEDDEEPAGGLDVKKESEEGSMFVSPISNDQDHPPEKSKGLGSPSDPKPSSDKEQDSKPPSDNSHEKPPPPKVDFQNGLATPSTEDELDLVRANPVRELFHDGASENVGWSRLAFGRAFNIERQGPPNAARFRFRRQNDELKTKSLDDIAYGIIPQINGAKLYQCGDIMSIRGVAWQPLKGIDHYSSLTPRNWKQGNRTEDERGHGGATVQCEEDLRLGEAVILEKGETYSLCDFMIVTAAYRYEKRFQEWQSKQRPGRDRSPTPGLPLLNNENKKQLGSGESSDKARSSQQTDKPEGAEGQADTTH
ncbi:hypothetical protein G3M48_009561 [Beauveria asiatica]|uniref:Uncharacterized protein n=1 Tax=Beauveria asiatica TaxID=1069075 RepID=A0AAW0S348_9HYPO